MSYNNESYIEELGFHDLKTVDGLVKGMAYDIIDFLVEKLAYSTDEARASINVLLDEDATPAELLKRIEKLIGDGFKFDDVALRVQNTLKREMSGDLDIFAKKRERDANIAKFEARTNAEIDDWMRDGKVPIMSQDAQDYLNSLIEQQIRGYKKD